MDDENTGSARIKDASPDKIRASLIESSLAWELEQERTIMFAGVPPKPDLPDGLPQDFIDALFTPGICAVPLWCGDAWRYAGVCDGAPVFDYTTNSIVRFDTYDLAISQMLIWDAWRKANPQASR